MFLGYHTNQHRGNMLNIPVFAEGNSQWLGDGYYFWQDYEFALEWGQNRICRGSDYRNGKYSKFDIYEAEIDVDFPSEMTIDTVFNEEDYRNFLASIERFAQAYIDNKGSKPTLEEFNDYIQDKNLWQNIIAIRFQDLPTNARRDYLLIKKFYYKKRIQIVLYDINKITKFARIETGECSSNT